MNSRTIKIAAGIAFCSLLLVVFSLFRIYRGEQSLFVGNLVFSNSEFNENKIKEIIIRRAGETVTLIPDGDFWHVKEADNYYAAFDLIRRLYDNFRDSRFTSRKNELPSSVTGLRPASFPSEKDETDIIVLGKDEKELNHIVIGSRSGKDNLWYARLPTVADTFTVSGLYIFPDELKYWTQQPLVALKMKDLQAVSIEESKVSRRESSLPFVIFQDGKMQRQVQLEAIERTLLYLAYDKVLSAQNFDDTLYPERRNLSFTLFSGLIYSLDIFTDNHEFWVKLTLLTTTLPTTETNDYIRHNAFLYDGWFFKLPESTGRLLYQYQL